MSKYGIILTAICVVDLISTIIFINFFGGGEANPLLFQSFLIGGSFGLAITKVFMNGIAISCLEICYHKKPPVIVFGKKIKFHYILIINLYIAVYAICIGSQ